MSQAGVRDVATHAGVSPATVSNYLNHPDKLASATADRIRNAIDELGYVGNSAARALRVGESETIGHLTFEVGNPFFYDFSKGVQDRAAETGYSVLIANTAGSAEREERYFDLFEAQRIKGLLLSPLKDSTRRLQSLRKRGIPIVLIDKHRDGVDCSSVSVDDVEGGRLAVDHLIQKGRKRILFVGGPLDLDSVADRLKGAKRAVRAATGVELEVLEIADRTIPAGRDSAAHLLERTAAMPDGIFAANDLVAVGMLHVLLRSGRCRVPEDIALIGYDDIDFAAEAIVPLTSVRRPGELFGRTALDLLHRQINAGGPPERVVFQPTLVPRRSTLGDTSADE